MKTGNQQVRPNAGIELAGLRNWFQNVVIVVVHVAADDGAVVGGEVAAAGDGDGDPAEEDLVGDG